MAHNVRFWMTAATALALASVAQAAPLKEMEVRSEPVRPDGQQDYTLRLLPRETHQCEDIVVECVYRQEFPWEDFRGRKTVKVLEPITFTFRRHDVRLVNELDAYISFRVPVSLPVLVEKYGSDIFNADAPVTVPRLRVRALRQGAVLWEYEIKTNSLLLETDLAAAAVTNAPAIASTNASAKSQPPEGR